MIGYFISLFCSHKWEIIHHIVQRYYNPGTNEIEKRIDKFILQCEKCGKIKKKEQIKPFI